MRSGSRRRSPTSSTTRPSTRRPAGASASRWRARETRRSSPSRTTEWAFRPRCCRRLFEMFTQVDRSLERSQGGLGIGLAIVKRLVEMHGGSVDRVQRGGGDRAADSWCASPWPVASAGAELARREGRPAGPPVRRRILVVDDNEDSAISMAMLLTGMGNETRTAHEGLEALESRRDVPPRDHPARHRDAEAQRVRDRAAHPGAAVGPDRDARGGDGVGPGRRPPALAGSGVRPPRGQAGRSGRAFEAAGVTHG